MKLAFIQNCVAADLYPHKKNNGLNLCLLLEVSNKTTIIIVLLLTLSQS